MRTLNLAYPERGNIPFTSYNFPDGQQNITLHLTEEVLEVVIKARLNNWMDLEKIVCAVASLREAEVEDIYLEVPYIMGARSDRKFEKGGNNYLKNVICLIINSLNFKRVTCIDPHSDVLEACIKRFRKESNYDVVHFALSNLSSSKYRTRQEYSNKDCILVSPDAGASKKIYKLAEQIGYNGDIITCSKDRDENGKLTKCVVPFNHDEKLYGDRDFVIIDDICDGGATFINIAKEIRRDFPNNKIYLIITHGIFSKGYKELLQYFDGIYTTNSYSDFRAFEDSDVKYLDRVNYLNVF